MARKSNNHSKRNVPCIQLMEAAKKRNTNIGWAIWQRYTKFPHFWIFTKWKTINKARNLLPVIQYTLQNLYLLNHRCTKKRKRRKGHNPNQTRLFVNPQIEVQRQRNERTLETDTSDEGNYLNPVRRFQLIFIASRRDYRSSVPKSVALLFRRRGVSRTN